MNASSKLDKFSVITSGVILLLQVAHNLQLTSSFCERYNSLPQQGVKNKEASYKEERNKTIVPRTSNCQDEVASSGHWLLTTSHILDHIVQTLADFFPAHPTLMLISKKSIYPTSLFKPLFAQLQKTADVSAINQKYYPYFGNDTSSAWHFAAFVFLRRHFAEKTVLASRNVGCFFRLFLGKERVATGDLVVATTKSHLAETAAH